MNEYSTYQHPKSDLMSLLSIAAVTIWSATYPYEWLTWFLEAAPIFILFIGAMYTYKRFPFTSLAYWLFALGCILVLIGAHYTYARMPIFTWLQEGFALSRNHYDRFGHFFQGVVSAILFREVLLRTSSLRKGVWCFILVIALCMAKSMLYEFAEWWTTIILGEDANDYLAMQGDEWDVQKDMFLATIGSILSLVFFTRLHEQRLQRVTPQNNKE